MSELELQGRTALVTGGAKGIGRACCQRLAAAGSKVAVNYFSSEDAAREVVEQIENEGGGRSLAEPMSRRPSRSKA